MGTQTYRQWQFLLQRSKSPQCFQQHTILQISCGSIVGLLSEEGHQGLQAAFTPQPGTPSQFPQSELCCPSSSFALLSAGKHGSTAPGTTSASVAASQLDWGWDQQLGEDFCPTSWEERDQAVRVLRKPLYIFTWQGGLAEAVKQMKHILHPVIHYEKGKTPCQMKRQ